MLRGKMWPGPLKYGARQAYFFQLNTDMMIRLAMHVGIVKQDVMRADPLAVSADRTARPAYMAKFNHGGKETNVHASACH